MSSLDSAIETSVVSTGLPTYDTTDLRSRLAGLGTVAPIAAFDDDHRRCTDKLCVVLASFYAVSSSRLALWDHIAKAIDLAAARVRDPERFVSQAIAGVHGDFARSAGAKLAAELIADLRRRDPAWLSGWYDYLRLAPAAWVVRGTLAWRKRWRRTEDPRKPAFDLRRAFDADPLAETGDDVDDFVREHAEPTRDTVTL